MPRDQSRCRSQRVHRRLSARHQKAKLKARIVLCANSVDYAVHFMLRSRSCYILALGHLAADRAMAPSIGGRCPEEAQVKETWKAVAAKPIVLDSKPSAAEPCVDSGTLFSIAPAVNGIEERPVFLRPAAVPEPSAAETCSASLTVNRWLAAHRSPLHGSQPKA